MVRGLPRLSVSQPLSDSRVLICMYVGPFVRRSVGKKPPFEFCLFFWSNSRVFDSRVLPKWYDRPAGEPKKKEGSEQRLLPPGQFGRVTIVRLARLDLSVGPFVCWFFDSRVLPKWYDRPPG